MNRTLGTLMMAATMFENMSYPHKPHKSYLRDKEESKTTSHSKDELAEHNGQKKFYYGENYVYAINQKNADKKAKNKGYL